MTWNIFVENVTTERELYEASSPASAFLHDPNWKQCQITQFEKHGVRGMFCEMFDPLYNYCNKDFRDRVLCLFINNDKVFVCFKYVSYGNKPYVRLFYVASMAGILENEIAVSDYLVSHGLVSQIAVKTDDVEKEQWNDFWSNVSERSQHINARRWVRRNGIESMLSDSVMLINDNSLIPSIQELDARWNKLKINKDTNEKVFRVMMEAYRYQECPLTLLTWVAKKDNTVLAYTLAGEIIPGVLRAYLGKAISVFPEEQEHLESLNPYFNSHLLRLVMWNEINYCSERGYDYYMVGTGGSTKGLNNSKKILYDGRTSFCYLNVTKPDKKS